MPFDADAYDARFRDLAATGAPMHGEADFVAALKPGRVLDAGCGTGRVAIELARRGIEVVGIDVDPEMLRVARRNAPDLDWRLVDLESGTGFDDAGLSDAGFADTGFDCTVMAGNVLIFVTSGSEGAVIGNMSRTLRPGGALVAGFQLVPGRITLAEYDAHCIRAGLVPGERSATWDRQPYAGGDYAVSLHRRGDG